MHAMIRQVYLASEQPGYRDPVSFGFSLVDTLAAHGHPIPSSVNYRPSPLGLTDPSEWSGETHELEAMLSTGDIEPDDLVCALEVTARFIRILNAMGA